MPFSAYADNKLIDHLLGSGTYTKPSGLYVALYVGDPLTSGAEVSTSGTGYARQSATFTITGGSATNTSAIEFPAATANWGTIDYCAIYDALSGGNMLVSAALTSAKTVATLDILRFQASTITVTLT